MKTIALIFCNFIFTTLSVLAQVEEEPCKLILQNGLYKTFKIEKHGNFQQDLKTYFASDEFKRDLQDNKWGGTVGVVIEGVPVEIGASASNNEISEFQRKVREATSLTITQSFYDYSVTRIPDVELANAYTQCILASRKFGFKITPIVNEKDVLFIVAYTKEFDQDPMPTVRRFEIRGGTNVSKSFNVGDKLTNQTSISSDRNPEGDLTLILETDRGLATYRVPADPSGFNKDFPVGTIIISYLNWSEFQQVTKNNSNNPNGNVWASKYSKWSPADGRSIPNSAFQRVASQPNVPDLRGSFLRGLNQFDTDEPNQVSSARKDPDNRSRGSFQTDAFKSHNHDITDPGHNHSYREPGGAGSSGVPGNPQGMTGATTGTKTTGITIKNNGDVETRPKNIAIYYYIRIN